MNKYLYDTFAARWYRGGSIWVYSDPHFADPEMPYIRKNYIGDDEQVKRINSCVGKNDTLIILGDIGDVSFIQKLRGYKVLIMGNHDSNANSYKRVKESLKYTFSLNKEQLEVYKKIEKDWGIIDGPGDYHAMRQQQRDYINTLVKVDFYKRGILNGLLRYDDKGNVCMKYNSTLDTWYYFVDTDNHLFDEVYEGPLFIGDRLLLSHEPISLPYALNIHGHDHSNWLQLQNCYNVCAEHINYKPVCLKNILNSGIRKDIDSIHRITIDNATKKAKAKKVSKKPVIKSKLRRKKKQQ